MDEEVDTWIKIVIRGFYLLFGVVVIHIFYRFFILKVLSFESFFFELFLLVIVYTIVTSFFTYSGLVSSVDEDEEVVE